MSSFVLLALLPPRIVLYTVIPLQRSLMSGILIVRMRNGMRNCMYNYSGLRLRRLPLTRLDELVFRFEEPNDRRKWDDPCFVVGPEDTLPCENIYDFLCASKNSVIPNQATAYVSTFNEFKCSYTYVI